MLCLEPCLSNYFTLQMQPQSSLEKRPLYKWKAHSLSLSSLNTIALLVSLGFSYLSISSITIDIITVYAIAASSLFSVAILTRSLYYLAPLKNVVSILFSKHLIYPYFIARHHFISPWSRLSVLTSAIYLVANLLCLLFNASSTSDIGH